MYFYENKSNKKSQKLVISFKEYTRLAVRTTKENVVATAALTFIYHSKSLAEYIDLCISTENQWWVLTLISSMALQ